MRRLVVVEVEALGRYCDNCCQHMTIDGRRCHLFGRDLEWDPRRKTNGNRRLSECRKAERAHAEGGSK